MRPPISGTRSAETEPGPTPGNRRGRVGILPPTETRWMPGQSGNLAGRPKGDGVVRRLILEALRKNRKAAFKAIEARLRSPKYVQDVLELLAKLEGELSKDAQEGARQ